MTEAAPFAGFGGLGLGAGAGGGGLGGEGTATGTPGALRVMSPYYVPPSRRAPQEFYVRSSTGWKAAFERLRPGLGSARPSSSSEGQSGSGSSSKQEAKEARSRREREAEETTRVIAGCREELGELWRDEVVRAMLKRRRLRLEEGGGL